MGFSGSAIARAGALGMAVVSPAFVTFLLLKVCLLCHQHFLTPALIAFPGLWSSNERVKV